MIAQAVSNTQDVSEAKEMLIGYLTESVDRSRNKAQANKLKILILKTQQMNSKTEVEKLAWNLYLKDSSNPYDVY